jgi:hypothetical protein
MLVFLNSCVTNLTLFSSVCELYFSQLYYAHK